MTQELRPTRPEGATDPREILATLRPQAYGDSGPQKIRDALVEPLWTGVRTLAAVDGGGALLVDPEGDPVPGMAVRYSRVKVILWTDAPLVYVLQLD